MKTSQEEIISAVLDIERSASARFNDGDVTGYLDIYRDDVTYVDPMTKGVLHNKKTVKAYFDDFYLGIKIDRVEWLNEQAIVNETGNTVILTYNQQNHIRSKKDGKLHQIPLWNCTEIYRLTDGQWRIAHANWSFAQHPALLVSLQKLFAQLGY